MATALGGVAETAEAGWLLAPGLKWTTFSAQPEDAEPTRNYEGYGLNLSFGYSAGQVWDLALFGQYVPGRAGAASVGEEDASFVMYGGEMAFRIASSIYFGLRGGIGAYKLVNQTRDDEVPGAWEGPGGGISIGAIHKLSKRSSLQTSFDITTTVMEPLDDQVDENGEKLGKRRFDAFSVTFSYVFNGYKSHLIESNLFKGFLDSMLFF